MAIGILTFIPGLHTTLAPFGFAPSQAISRIKSTAETSAYCPALYLLHPQAMLLRPTSTLIKTCPKRLEMHERRQSQLNDPSQRHAPRRDACP